jgi:hypothetical protein
LIRTWVPLFSECPHLNPQPNPTPVAGFGSRVILWRRRDVGRGAGTELLPWLVVWGLNITIMCRAGCRNGGWFSRSLLICYHLPPLQMMRSGSCIPQSLSDCFVSHPCQCDRLINPFVRSNYRLDRTWFLNTIFGDVCYSISVVVCCLIDQLRPWLVWIYEVGLCLAFSP